MHSSSVSRFRALPFFQPRSRLPSTCSLSHSLSLYISSFSLNLAPHASFPKRSLFLKFLALRYFAGGRSSKIRYARFPPITHVNSARSSRAENRKIVGPGKRLWPLLVGARRPPQSNNIPLNFCKFAVPLAVEWRDCCCVEIPEVLRDSLNCGCDRTTPQQYRADNTIVTRIYMLPRRQFDARRTSDARQTRLNV